jgi:ribosomal protein L16/L10AE
MTTAYGKLSKIFNIDIRIVPNKVLTSKGILVRMGHGKGKIKSKFVYITRGTVIIQLTKISNVPITSSMFDNFFKKYPYLDFKWLK